MDKAMSESPKELTNLEISNRIIELNALMCEDVAAELPCCGEWVNAARRCASVLRQSVKQEDSDDGRM